MTVKNVLIIPASPLEFDVNLALNLSYGMSDIGLFAKVQLVNPNKSYIKDYLNSFDLVIGINTILFDIKNVNFIYINWIQDVYLETEEFLKKFSHPKAYTYTLGSYSMLNFKDKPNNYLGSLLPGSGELEINNISSFLKKTDYFLYGFIPSKLANLNTLHEEIFYFFRKFGLSTSFAITSIISNNKGFTPQQFVYPMELIIEKNYSPLTGSLDIHKLKEILYKTYNKTEPNFILRRNLRNFFYKPHNLTIMKVTFIDKFFEGDLFYHCVKFYAHTYPRFLDRYKIALQLKNNKNSYLIQGPGWDKTTFKKFSKKEGNVNENINLSSMVICNNTHGLGLHARFFEALKGGALPILHKSNNDSLPGGILYEGFENNKGFAYYDKDDLIMSTAQYSGNSDLRKNPLIEGYKIVNGKHLWKHRALQIINDLKKIA